MENPQTNIEQTSKIEQPPTTGNQPVLKKQRQSNFELLRIISMILIIAHHIAVHSNFVDTSGFNNFFISFFSIGGKIGAIVFVLISGYFISKKSFSLKKLILLILEVVFYSTIIYVIFVIAGMTEFNAKNFFVALTPVCHNNYWFASAYIIAYIFSPLISLALEKIPKKIMFIILAVIFTLEYVVTIFISLPLLNNVVYFISFMMVAGYIRKYNPKILNFNILNVIVFIISFLCLFLAKDIWNVDLWLMETIPTLTASISLFAIFKNINIKNNKFINIVASTTFGIYLIHENNMLKKLIYNNIFSFPNWSQNFFFVAYALLGVAIIFASCSIIDLVRQKFVFQPVQKMFSRHKNREK